MLVVVHHCLHHLGIIATHTLHVEAYGHRADHACRCLMAMAEIEMDVGMTHKLGLAMSPERELRRLLDAILLAERSLQQLIGGKRKTLVVLLPIAQRMVASLLTDSG